MKKLIEALHVIQEECKKHDDWATVDTNWLIQDIKRDFKDKAEEVLKHLSGYAVHIDWTGTPYERK